MLEPQAFPLERPQRPVSHCGARQGSVSVSLLSKVLPKEEE